MRNILSFKPGTKIKGKEIKDWIRYHTENQTSHSSEAKKMTKYLNIDDDKYYKIYRGDYHESERSFQVWSAED